MRSAYGDDEDGSARLAAAVELARTEAVVLERHRRRAAALVSSERYEQLMAALEDAEDIATFDVRDGRAGTEHPWGWVKADLGWE